MKNTIKYGSLAYLAIYVILILAGMFGNLRGETGVYIQLIEYTILGISGVFLFKDCYKEGFVKWKEKPFINLLWLAGGFAVNYVLSIIASLPVGLLFPDYGSLNSDNVFRIKGLIPLWLAVAVLGILGPMTEEQIFRMLLIRKQEKRFVPAYLILFSSLVFMVLHIHAFTAEDILSNLPILTSGLVYGFIAYKSKNVTIPLILHLLTNIPSIVALYIY